MRAVRAALITAVITATSLVHQATKARPAAAWAAWTQVQHNIQGLAHPAHSDDPELARYVVNWINATDAIAASVNEVCQSQADFIWGALAPRYHIWFVKALPNQCGDTEDEPYGNVLLVAKDPTFSVTRDDTHDGYPWPHQGAVVSTPDTRVFGYSPSNYDPPERKRVDCAEINGTSAGFKFKVCTAHLHGHADPSSAQVRALRDDSHMLTPTMFIGDINKNEDWLYQEVGSWQKDDPRQYPDPTYKTGQKIDWVLGRNHDHFAIRDVSEPQEYGRYQYLSDHRLLVAFMKAQYN